jgi:hypothetical protein
MRLLREWRRRDGGGGELFRVQLGLRLELGLRIYSERQIAAEAQHFFFLVSETV